jgi:hypothetical protein
MSLDIQQYISGAVAAIVLSAAVRALPEPEPMGNKFYGWFYRFTHGLLANFDKLKAGM